MKRPGKDLRRRGDQTALIRSPLRSATTLAGIAGLVALAVIPAEALDEPLRVGLVAVSSGLVVAGVRASVAHHRRLLSSLAEAATTDPLTGLLNRRAFQQRIEQELARAQREGSSFSLLVADLDDFKAVNDSLGHLGGDMTLERAAGVICKSIRATDSAARMGGEEFAIILPATTPMQALAFAERLRRNLEHGFEGTAAPVTTSIGVAGYPEHARTAEQLLGAADTAMYAGKRLGKNRCVVHSDGRSGSSPGTRASPAAS